jgi:hypothetical protein
LLDTTFKSMVMLHKHESGHGTVIDMSPDIDAHMDTYIDTEMEMDIDMDLGIQIF